MTTMLGWHFINEARTLGYGDNREVRVGETLAVDCEPVICAAGLHACEKALHALQYAPGPVVCRVRLSGRIVIGLGNDGTPKVAATERTVLAMADATSVLHAFACDCAERALTREREAGREPDPRSWAAIDAKRRWLKGEAADEELDAACAAACAAARAARAARAAARDARAARDAAWAAAWAAAYVACAAGWAAARGAAWAAAARAAEREWQLQRLEELLRELLGLEGSAGAT